jgi:dCTP deaminase
LRKGEALCIYQGQFILGETMERLKLPGDLMGSVNGRTRFARAGLNVHTTAPSLNPLTNNRTALEISDEGEQPLVLIPGTKICQVSFIRCWGTVDENKGDYTKEQL